MAKEDSAILVHYTEDRRYVLFTEGYLPSGRFVSMIAPFSYNNSQDQEEVHRHAMAYGLDRAAGLGVELVEKVEKSET